MCSETYKVSPMKSPLGLLLTAGLLPIALYPSAPDPNTIIQRSVEVLKLDWQADSAYDYFERDRGHQASQTWQVMMIQGSPYRRLQATGSTPLSPKDQEKEQRKLEAAVAQRCSESSQQRQQRIQEYQKDRDRDHRMMNQLTAAFVFQLVGQERLRGRTTWILKATPKPGYQPTSNETKVLTGMQGKLWVDKATFQWVRVDAFVIHPVSIEGFLARVEPGTEFELEKRPVSGGIWLPSHFFVRSKAEVLSFIGHKTHDDETYFNYQKADQIKTPACPANVSARRP